ncbi:PRA1 family protein F2-like [Henckelia pumila]|uniref:PRA1 family protein F2-like n=1 Tax=Henckelia pumila TaxID=405737 RepID=UPI003C6E1350
MTNYGTIPAARLEYISRAKERIKSGLATRRPWREMFDFRSLNLPSSFSDAVERVKTNAAYFTMNYVILILLILFLSLLWHPVSLIVFIVMMAAWLVLYFLRHEPLVIFGRTITDRVTLIVLSVVTVVVLLLTGAVANVLLALVVGVAVVVIHAAVMKTDDLVFDEAAGGLLRSSA